MRVTGKPFLLEKENPWEKKEGRGSKEKPWFRLG